MKKTAFSILALLLASAVYAGEPSPNVMTAKKTIKAFAGQLGGELKAAMKAGGPVNAITACNAKAPTIAMQMNAGGKVKISRTSLKHRNSDNAPTDWQKAVLMKFEERKTAGEDVMKIAYSEVVGDEFRFMKAIPTAEICLNCHGSKIDSKVTAKLDELYPNDLARGYAKGDIRGAFYVTMPK